MNCKRVIFSIGLAILLTGCAGGQINPGAAADAPGVAQSQIFSSGPPDKDLYARALESLNNDPDKPDFRAARESLVRLLDDHPKSRWADSARTVIRLIDERSLFEQRRDEDRQQRTREDAKWTRDLAALKEQLQAQEEKYLAELARLKQENEKLHLDLQQLRNLEVQLEKREKMLR